MTVENVHVGLPGLSPSLPFLRRVLVLVGSSGACWMGPRVIFFPFLPSSFSTSAQRPTHTHTTTRTHKDRHTHNHTHTHRHTTQKRGDTQWTQERSTGENNGA